MAKKEYTDDDLLASRIEDIISDQIYIERVPYSMDEHAMQVNYESRLDAARKIVEYLKSDNLISNWKLSSGGELSGGENVVRLSDETLAHWKTFLEERERERKIKQEKEEKLAKMKADPNFKKYAAEIGEKHGYKIGDQFFEQMFYLHKMLEETPKEELEKYFEEIRAEGIGSEGPTVEEYFQSLDPAFQYQKGYSEGGKIMIEKVTERLSEDERPLIPSAEIIALMRYIYENE